MDEIIQSISPLFLRYKVLPKHHDGNNMIIASLPGGLSSSNKVFEEINTDPKIMLVKTQTSSVFNFLTEDFSAKLHFVRDEDFDWLSEYYQYSLSPIIGKLFHRADLKYSQAGLEYVQYSKEGDNFYKSGKILVTRDFKKVLEILSLDYKEFQSGFKTQEKVFEFVVKSPFFKPEMFLRSDKKYKDRTLNAIREYLIKTNFQNYPQKFTVEYISGFVPEINLLEGIKKLEAYAGVKETCKTKFDGRLIMRVFPNIEPKQISEYHSRFKKSFQTTPAFQNFVLESSEEQIIDKLKEVVHG
jgi:hypothetical protein